MTELYAARRSNVASPRIGFSLYPLGFTQHFRVNRDAKPCSGWHFEPAVLDGELRRVPRLGSFRAAVVFLKTFEVRYARNKL